MRKFGEAVAGFARGDKVTLVITGDFLDLALSSHGIVPLLPDKTERRWVTDQIMKKLRDVLPSPQSAGISRARYAGVEKTRDALWNWIRLVSPLKDRVQDMTQFTHVVYGHTHVVDSFQFPGTTMISWNLGSWLIERGEPPPEPGFLGIDANGIAKWFQVR